MKQNSKSLPKQPMQFLSEQDIHKIQQHQYAQFQKYSLQQKISQSRNVSAPAPP